MKLKNALLGTAVVLVCLGISWWMPAQSLLPSPVNIAGASGGTCAALGGDISGTCAAATVSKINGTSFAGSANNLVRFGAFNTPFDTGISYLNVTQKIATGAKALATTAISSAACSAAQTDTATGALGTDTVVVNFNADPSGVTGYVPLTAGSLYIYAYPTMDTVNFKACNNTSGSITPGAVTINWKVVR